MGSKKKKKDATYQVAVSGAKGAIRILLYVLLICVLIFVGKTAYSFGYLIFYQEPEAHTQADGQDVTVIVHEDDSVYDVGETLQEKGRRRGRGTHNREIRECREKFDSAWSAPGSSPTCVRASKPPRAGW